MFTKPSMFVAFLVGSFFINVESVKSGIPIEYSLAARDGLTKASECFSEFSDNQANTVKKMGEDWQVCRDKQTSADKEVAEDLTIFSYNIAKVPNSICVKIDNECRNAFATTGDTIAALECYAKVPMASKTQIVEMAQDCKLKLLTAEIEGLSIRATRKNCTTNAYFKYLETSDILLDKLVKTCKDPPSDSSTTISTTLSTLTSPVQSTTSKVSSTTEIGENPATSTESLQTETTAKGRFPWN